MFEEIASHLSSTLKLPIYKHIIPTLQDKPVNASANPETILFVVTIPTIIEVTIIRTVNFPIM